MPNEIFQGAHDFVFNQTINVAAGSGLKKLLRASMPEAFYDSGTRDPPRCHLGTRLDYIKKICTWGSNPSQQHPESIFWMEGPAGVGKSAIAQTCAELLSEQNHLGAAFFFSRPNQRDSPKGLFPSLSYQIATKSISFRDIIDRDVCNDPTLVEKSLTRQFHELLVKPLLEASVAKEYVIIIDGLDECFEINAQREIVEIIAKSVQDQTTPFRWAFFSRPESHIITSFASDAVRPVLIHLELPVSRNINHEILCYLIAEFEKTREEHGLPSSWPSMRDLEVLVDHSAGLYIYASTVIRVVGDRNSRGPIAQLRRIISFMERDAGDRGSNHLLSELDLFYRFILKSVPPDTLLLLQKILLLCDVMSRCSNIERASAVWIAANSLDLSELEFRNACAPLRSVLKPESRFRVIKFYHASFMDFLKDPHRSQEFCIFGTCLDVARQDLFDRLNGIHAQTQSTVDEEGDQDAMYECCVNTFFSLCSYPRPLPSSTAVGLAGFQFTMILRLYPSYGGNEIDLKALRQNIPVELRNKVIRRGYNPAVYFYKPKLTKWGQHYILGQGKHRVVWWPENEERYQRFVPYPSVLKF